MIALQKISQGPGAAFRDVAMPAYGPRDLLIQVRATALCKSDVEVLEWTPLVASSNLPLPLTLGHEFAGEVVAAGELVKSFKVGDHVAGETHIPCEICHECRTDHRHICTGGMGVLGRNVNGCFAEYIALPEISAIHVSPDAPYEEMALMEPLGTALHALQKAEPSGKTVAILGVGTIGLMACEMARALGATRVIALDVNPERLRYSLTLGADVALNGREDDFVQRARELTHGVGVDAVVDFTGSPRVIDQAIDALRTAGTLVHVGMVGAELTIPQYMYRVVYRELVLTGIFGRHLYKTWELLDALLDAKKVTPGRYVAGTMPLSDYETAWKRFDSFNGRAVMIP